MKFHICLTLDVNVTLCGRIYNKGNRFIVSLDESTLFGEKDICKKCSSTYFGKKRKTTLNSRVYLHPLEDITRNYKMLMNRSFTIFGMVA